MNLLYLIIFFGFLLRNLSQNIDSRFFFFNHVDNMYNIGGIYLFFIDMFLKLNIDMGKDEMQYECREDMHHLKSKN